MFDVIMKVDGDDERTDSDRLDYLQGLLEGSPYTRRCVLRWSSTGRGFRLHETSLPDAHDDIRAAIDEAMDEGGPQKFGAGVEP